LVSLLHIRSSVKASYTLAKTKSYRPAERKATTLTAPWMQRFLLTGDKTEKTKRKRKFSYLVGVRGFRLDIVRYDHFCSSPFDIYHSIKKKNLRSLEFSA
jgi:hypothetical protein